MHIGVAKESASDERRAALTPEGARKLIAADHTVTVESGVGTLSGIADEHYVEAGAAVGTRTDVVDAQVVIQVLGPDQDIRDAAGPDTLLLGLFDPLWDTPNAEALAATGANVMALELVPRITRAQSMDVLSSMATVTGYEAVLLAARRLPRMFPLMMTAAGTVPAAKVFILGAGVAGLQAIATARRLGAVVEAFDVRPAAAEQIRSLGARAVELDLDTDNSEDAGGYAKAQGEDAQSRQQAQLTPVIAESDVIITTAAIPGRRSPLLVTTPMVEAMEAGSVIVDLAAERGGNCELTIADGEVDHQGVTILGPTTLASQSARNASQMLSNNIVTLLQHLAPEGDLVLDRDDEITNSMLVASGGEIVHERVRQAVADASADDGQGGQN